MSPVEIGDPTMPIWQKKLKISHKIFKFIVEIM